MSANASGKSSHLDCDESASELVYKMLEDCHPIDDDGVLFVLSAKKAHRDSGDSVTLVHRYLLACCRRIWLLIPDSGSRNGVIAAEQYCLGNLSGAQLNELDYHSEGSAFMFEYGEDDDRQIVEYVNSVYHMRELVSRLLVPPVQFERDNIRELLCEAAYFANFAMNFPWISGGTSDGRRESWRERGKFMPMSLFVEMS